MKLTLWFLNRITQWEVDRPGELGHALVGGTGSEEPRHDVRLGRRILATTPPGTGTVDLTVNNTEPSFRGELMHEGHQQAVDGMGKSAYDEYFMPIPLKCLGRPDYDDNGNARLTAFWKGLIRPEKQSEFLRILTPGLSENHCFDAVLVDGYWKEGKRPVAGDSELAKEFSDVRMNTSPREQIGYYQILQQAKQKHGPNVLIGYSQGGAVVNYLAYIDEHFVAPDKRCVAGVISVQGALRGSTLAMSSRQEAVLNSLVQMVHALWGERLLEFFAVPAGLRARVDTLLEPHHKLEVAEVVEVLDILYGLAKPDKGLSHFIATARKWLSGLDGDKQLAFWDLDSVRLNRPGSVMEALDNHPLMDTYCGAVAGDNFHLEPLLHSVIEFKHPGVAKLGFIVRGLLRHIVHPSEVIFQTKTFDMMPKPLTPLNDALARLHSDWLSGMSPDVWSIQNGETVPAQASDCVIPTACQLLTPVSGNRPKFFGNYINKEASHVSGAVLDNPGPKDIDYVKELLGRISAAIPLAEAAKG
jgi:hypothetical protein